MGCALVGEVGRELWLYREVVYAVLTLSAPRGLDRKPQEVPSFLAGHCSS